MLFAAIAGPIAGDLVGSMGLFGVISALYRTGWLSAAYETYKSWAQKRIGRQQDVALSSKLKQQFDRQAGLIALLTERVEIRFDQQARMIQEVQTSMENHLSQQRELIKQTTDEMRAKLNKINETIEEVRAQITEEHLAIIRETTSVIESRLEEQSNFLSESLKTSFTKELEERLEQQRALFIEYDDKINSLRSSLMSMVETTQQNAAKLTLITQALEQFDGLDN
eukprot:TRINITY_DN7490_c0_g1_i1.p1 TRINITY_DN7490_c0_g1~~TRINITY_DN7490_c0_g1_i1.p1  ORF type:complete len:225 (+),score=61.04 TRINITY_DN7490_c0_g1_i1:64-738(+)